MGINTKNQMLQLLRTMQAAVISADRLSENRQVEQLREILSQIQGAAIEVGNTLETVMGEKGLFMVHQLEEYCEYLWQCSQAESRQEEKVHILRLQHMGIKLIEELQSIPVRYEVVFFPYKASMWECMDSVWRAACKDQDCDVYVVPIPYYDFNSKREIIAEHYEGSQFPKEVPITDYRSFSLAQHRPDMAYIHNPFDQYNYVTSVHPDYYSKELKKYVGKLVYIPYFISAGPVSAAHREQLSYYYVDYIAVQSEKIIESFAKSIPREKFLPLGTPIADRILRLDEHKPDIPEEWKPMLPNRRDFGGRKAIMLNSSITMLMMAKDRFLDKLEEVIEIVGKMEKLLLIWRPHPLLFSTAVNMGEHYAERLKEIERKFLEAGTGVLDQTADVGVAAALCSAYIGEYASSVIYMFGVVDKPRFFIGVCPQKYWDMQRRDELVIRGKWREGNEEYFILETFGVVCKRNIQSQEVEIVFHIPDAEYYQEEPYRDICRIQNCIYLQPYCAQGLLIYNCQNGQITKRTERDSRPCGFSHMHVEEKKIYLIPEKYPQVVCFDTEKEEFSYLNQNEYAIPHTEENRKMSAEVLPEKLIASLYGEKLEKTNVLHIWYEDLTNNLRDYLYFISFTEEAKLRGIWGIDQNWIAALDGSCGEKIHYAVKESMVIQ